ncbi:MAG: hypothetical protein GY749_18370 [Desulfobacteraceae bacterium]|nr:hypothetical protein [Desulfobacteraceae bacterium]
MLADRELAFLEGCILEYPRESLQSAFPREAWEREKPEHPADDRSGSKQARFVEDRCKFKISRSQAGLLREYLNPLLSENIIRENLTARIKKYEEKSQEQMQKLLKKIKTRMDISVEDMRAFIVNYLEELAIHWWFEKDKEKDHEADRS